MVLLLHASGGGGGGGQLMTQVLIDQVMVVQAVAVQEVMYFLVEQIQALQEQLTLEEAVAVEYDSPSPNQVVVAQVVQV